MDEEPGLRRQYPVRPFIGVLAVVQRGGRFLLIERGRPPNAGAWGFPGGVQELGETAAEAAIRELFEETGVQAGDPRMMAPFDIIDRDEGGLVRYQFLLVPVLLTWRKGECTLSEEAADFRWLDEQSLDSVPALPRVKDVLAAVRELTPP